VYLYSSLKHGTGLSQQFYQSARGCRIVIYHGICLDIDVLKADFDRQITQLKKIARKPGINEIYFRASPGMTLHGLFIQQYDVIPSFPVIFKQLIGYTPTDKIKFTSADIDTF